MIRGSTSALVDAIVDAIVDVDVNDHVHVHDRLRLDPPSADRERR